MMNPHWINFRHLYAFWMVARAGSFTAAAREMHIAQSAVSAHVASLEEYLERPLLLRTNRSLEITDAGLKLLGYADAIFSQSRAINAVFQDDGDASMRRTLRVGVVGGASRNFVFRALSHFIDRSPDVHLAVSTGSYPELYDMLKKFELDTIVSLELPRKKDLREVSYTKLGVSPICIVGTPEVIAPIRDGSPVDALPVFKFRHPFEFDVLGKYVEPMVDGTLELRMDTDDVPLLRFFANSGRGIAILPKIGVFEDLEAGTVEAIEVPRCPEVGIYGITMVQANPLLTNDEGVLDLWAEVPSVDAVHPADSS